MTQVSILQKPQLSDVLSGIESAVALTQISAHSMHKSLAVRKIMEAVCTVYTQIRTWFRRLELDMRQTITECTQVLWKEGRASFAEAFDEPCGKGAFEMCHSFLYFF